MSNVLALMKGRALELSDAPYFERADEKEHALEARLRKLAGVVIRRLPPKRRLQRFVDSVNALEADIKPLDDAELKSRFAQLSTKLRESGLDDANLAESFSIVREASRRILGMRHHDVQLMGGWTMLQGMIAEMATGEGKTLVATLAAIAAAGAGAAVHVITVNDYLAERDAEHNMPLFQFFGLTVGCIKEGMQPDERREQYRCNITYASNKEIVFDYLKDRIAFGGNQSEAHQKLRQLQGGRAAPAGILRGLHIALVDEADSVLIDEARTPLIISETQNVDGGGELYHQALRVAAKLVQVEHYNISVDREITVTVAGHAQVTALSADLPGVWRSSRWRRDLVQQALSALHGFTKDQHYIVVDDKIVIVDESTGRTMADRSWERGLHQMVEAKEGCEISGQRKTLARMTYQRFFRRYLLLAGMTGTAEEISAELWNVYRLKTLRIPTHKPPRRKRLPDRSTLDNASRWQMVADHAITVSQTGRPVLVGTRSVEASEILSQLLTAKDIPHTVLNARQDQDEAGVISAAGEAGRITVATNMAGRGTDIKLGDGVEAAGGLHVILTEFHDSGRVDRQSFGRSARQGNPGTVEAIVSLDDELFGRYAPFLTQLVRRHAKARNGVVSSTLLRGLVTYAQWIAEHKNTRMRMDTVKQDRQLQSMLAFSGQPD
jgi:preprotein translocase subunit SecA